MTERDLIKQVITKHYLDKDLIYAKSMQKRVIYNLEKGKTKTKKSRIPAVALAVIIICLSCITVFALSRLLLPSEVATALGQPHIAVAFENSEAIAVNESITEKGYTVTFLGITTGENLGELANERDKNYAVVAIENADGSPMDSPNSTSFFVSLFIRGLNPNRYHMIAFNGSYSEYVMDGILYRIIECDSVSIFADRGLYLGVTEGPFYDSRALIYNENDGTLAPNPEYLGLNVLFNLPIDEAKADPQKAKHYLDEMQEAEKEPASPKKNSDMVPDELPDAKEVMENAIQLEDSRQTLWPDADGNYRYSYSEEPGQEESLLVMTLELLNDYPVNEWFISSASSAQTQGGITKTWHTVCKKQDNGTLEAITYLLVK